MATEHKTTCYMRSFGRGIIHAYYSHEQWTLCGRSLPAILIPAHAPVTCRKCLEKQGKS